jgi:hypothetical protein
MRQGIRILGTILLAVAVSSPAWAKKGGGGQESQAGGLPGLEDRVEADEALIATLQAQVATLQGQVLALQTAVTTLQSDVAALKLAVTDLQGQNNWAVVNSDGTINRASSVNVTVTDAHVALSGIYEIDFGKDVSKCAYQATLGGTGTAPVPAGTITVTGDTDADSPNDVTVSTFNTAGVATDGSFHLLVTCP